MPRDLCASLIRECGASTGDTVKLTVRGREYTGILMPHHSFSDRDVLTLKLANGYNIGIALDKEARLSLIKKGEKIESPSILPKKREKETVAVLSTGGTIASYVDYRTGAVYPALTPEELVNSIPEVGDICSIKARVLYNLLSEDLTPEHWIKLAEETAKELNSGYKGVIIPHGTDTMAYTSAALSFMLSNLTGPVVLVGAQRSSDRPSSDATLNFISATKLAMSADLGEVVVVMHATTSDDIIAVHRGTRVRKMHTSRRDAFKSINGEPIGYITEKGIKLSGRYRARSDGDVEAFTNLERNVSMLYFYPGIKEEWIEEMLHRNKGVVIMGTGLGHISSKFIPMIEEAVRRGVVVVMTSQCLWGSVNMNVYHTGRELLRAGVLSGGDMLPEVAYIKLMWALGMARNGHDPKELMQQNIAGEMSEQRTL